MNIDELVLLPDSEGKPSLPVVAPISDQDVEMKLANELNEESTADFSDYENPHSVVSLLSSSEEENGVNELNELENEEEEEDDESSVNFSDGENRRSAITLLSTYEENYNINEDSFTLDSSDITESENEEKEDDDVNESSEDEEELENYEVEEYDEDDNVEEEEEDQVSEDEDVEDDESEEYDDSEEEETPTQGNSFLSLINNIELPRLTNRPGPKSRTRDTSVIQSIIKQHDNDTTENAKLQKRRAADAFNVSAFVDLDDDTDEEIPSKIKKKRMGNADKKIRSKIEKKQIRNGPAIAQPSEEKRNVGSSRRTYSVVSISSGSENGEPGTVVFIMNGFIDDSCPSNNKIDESVENQNSSEKEKEKDSADLNHYFGDKKGKGDLKIPAAIADTFDDSENKNSRDVSDSSEVNLPFNNVSSPSNNGIDSSSVNYSTEKEDNSAHFVHSSGDDKAKRDLKIPAAIADTFDDSENKNSRDVGDTSEVNLPFNNVSSPSNNGFDSSSVNYSIEKEDNSAHFVHSSRDEKAKGDLKISAFVTSYESENKNSSDVCYPSDVNLPLNNVSSPSNNGIDSSNVNYSTEKEENSAHFVNSSGSEKAEGDLKISDVFVNTSYQSENKNSVDIGHLSEVNSPLNNSTGFDHSSGDKKGTTMMFVESAGV